MTLRCEICNKLPKEDIAICLICGQILCLVSCEKKGKKGNLTRHARHKHCGATVYLLVYCSKILLIHNPHAFLAESAYFSQYGEPFNLSRKNWNEFYLDDKRIAKIHKMILRHRIVHEIQNLSTKLNRVYKTEHF